MNFNSRYYDNFIKSIVLVFNDVLSNEILVEKRIDIYLYWGGVNTLEKVCVKASMGG